MAAHDPNDPFGLDELLPTGRAKKDGGERRSQQLSGTACSVSSVQAGELTATAASEGATMAMHDKYKTRIKLADQDILNILFR